LNFRSLSEFARMIWLYTIKLKNEAFDIFRKFKVLVEKESDKAIKLLRTNSGGEYTSKEFEAFCINQGVVNEVTTSYTPQHNGLVERRNGTLLDMTRSIIKQKNLPQTFCSEEVTTTAYILTKCPTKKLNLKVPEEAWCEIMILIGYHPTGAYNLYNPVTQKVHINRDVIANEAEKWES
jgi:transposase InsO family protein